MLDAIATFEKMFADFYEESDKKKARKVFSCFPFVF